MKNARILLRLRLCFLLLAIFAAAPALGADSAPRRVLRVHIIHGLWDAYYGIDRGMALAGVPLVSDSWHSMSWGFGYAGTWDQHPGSGIDRFPTPETLATTDLVIVCNINGEAFKDGRGDALKKYVAGGGSVLFLGGRFTYGGQFVGTALEEIAPVTFEKGIDLSPAPDGLVMTPTPDAEPWLRNLPWDLQARTYWRHRVRPKPGAKVLVTFGAPTPEPALIVGTYGKGRVALFTGTVLGDPKEGQVAFWTWDGWPGAMAGMITWLTAPHPHDPDPDTQSIQAELAKAMEQEADGLPLAQFAAKVETLAKHCHDQATADFLVRLLASSQGDLPAAQVPTMAAALRLFAGPAWAAQAKTLVDSGLQGKTAIGLRLLGAAGGPDAFKTLSWFFTNANVRVAGSSGAAAAKADDMALPTPSGAPSPESAVVDPMVIRLGALEGLGSLASPDAVTLLRQALITLQDGKVSASKELVIDQLLPKHKLYEEALMAAVRCGHAEAVDPLFEAMLGNMNIVVRAKMELNKSEKNLKKIEDSIGLAIDWEREMEERMLTLPPSAQLLVARKVGASADRRVIRIALAAFAGRALSADVRAELIKSKFPAVVDLAK